MLSISTHINNRCSVNEEYIYKYQVLSIKIIIQYENKYAVYK